MRLSENATSVLKKRYLQRDEAGRVVETPDEMFRRVSKNISEAELTYKNGSEEMRAFWEQAFYAVMSQLDFLPNSPTLMNAGTDLQQLAACFVLPIDDSMESIFEAVKNTALIHKSGGGTGFSFSRVRPKDDIVRSTKGVSSGPVSFMKVFDAATEAVKQGGRRRGANMAILRVDHPDIVEFIAAKEKAEQLTNFNISIALTDVFMRAVSEETEYDLVNPRSGASAGRLEARMIMQKIVNAAWQTGEPGIIFIDQINRDNPTPHIGSIDSTNPCGEQPLLPYESCNLGSINLSRMVRTDSGRPRVDYEQIGRVVGVAVRFLDNVIDMNRYPVAEIEKLTKANRKIGLGVMGFADMLVQLGVPYDASEAVSLSRDVMRFVQTEARAASRRLAEERGAFANFRESVYDASGEPPIRNATTTTIAPTGSISIIANTSSGVEPIFALAYIRNVMDDDELIEVNPIFRSIAEREGFYSESLMKQIAEKGTVRDLEAVPERWRRVFRTSHDVDPDAHVRIQAAFQGFTDNAVSKTVNLPRSASEEDVERVYMLAFELGCKGVTVYRDGSRAAQVLNIGQVNREGVPSQRAPKKRPDVVRGSTRKMPTGCGNLYVTINDAEGEPFEIFAQIGKTGGCAASQTEAIGRLTSLSLRAGVKPEAVVEQLRGIRCSSPNWNSGAIVLSCADGISKVLETHLTEEGLVDDGALSLDKQSFVNRFAGQCPDCAGLLEFEGGCVVCRGCGYTRCG